MDRTPQQQAWINLALVPGLGPKFFQTLNQQSILPTQVYSLSMNELKKLGVSEKLARYLQQHPPSKPAKPVEQALTWQQSAGQYLLTPEHEHYPNLLKQIPTAPPLMFVKGQVSTLKLPQIAIVGSRYPTSSGSQQAYDFAQNLSHHGLVVTSGLAKGVDGIAHQATLDAAGSTIAVLGTGIDHIYPKSHLRLAEHICEKGALVSEFPLGAPAMKGHFPRRNRIVSGMSLGVLVIEATLKSGSLITARQALEQNREVMAIPGAIHNPQKAGCHHIIREGAKLIETPEQVVEEIGPMIDQKSDGMRKLDSTQLNERQLNLRGEQLKLYKALDYEGLDMESLVNKTQLDVSTLTMLLMELELGGWLIQEQGVYVKQ